MRFEVAGLQRIPTRRVSEGPSYIAFATTVINPSLTRRVMKNTANDVCPWSKNKKCATSKLTRRVVILTGSFAIRHYTNSLLAAVNAVKTGTNG